MNPLGPPQPAADPWAEADPAPTGKEGAADDLRVGASLLLFSGLIPLVGLIAGAIWLATGRLAGTALILTAILGAGAWAILIMWVLD